MFATCTLWLLGRVSHIKFDFDFVYPVQILSGEVQDNLLWIVVI